MFACQIWGQNINTLRKIQALKDEAVPIINFRTNNYDVGELYKNDKLLRISDYIKLLNCLFVRDVLTNFPITLSKNILLNQKI